MTKNQTIETILNVELLEQVLGGQGDSLPPTCQFMVDHPSVMAKLSPDELKNWSVDCRQQLWK